MISRLEGDAVISYALDTSFFQGQTLVEIIENTYVQFRAARQRIQLNTSCPCNACRNIPNLDLKFFVHHGTFVLQQMPGYKELVGNDVNVAHRLLKNHIVEQTGISAYAAFTQAAVDALGIDEFALELHEHIEEFPDVGEVKLFVEDLKPVWKRESQRRRVLVEPEDAIFIVETVVPAEPPLVWDYFTKPEYRSILMGADFVEIKDKSSGRMNEGAVYVCAHGDKRIPQPVLDWRPFEYFTYGVQLPAGATVKITNQFAPVEDGTRVLGLCSKPEGSIVARNVVKLMRAQAQSGSQQGFDTLREFIIKELESGTVVRPEATDVAAAKVAEAIKESLAEAGAD